MTIRLFTVAINLCRGKEACNTNKELHHYMSLVLEHVQN